MIKELWRRRVTLLAIPSGVRLRPWQICLSLRLLVLAAAGWAGLTLLVGFLGLRLADYTRLRADNHSLRVRLATLSSEMARTRAEFDAARDADKEIRTLLRLSAPAAQTGAPAAPSRIAAAASGSGGPAPADRRALLQSFMNPPTPAGADPLRRGLEDLERMSRERVASFQEIAAHLAWRRRLLRAMPSGWPTVGRITSAYGRRLSPMRGDEESDDREFHPGLDIANASGTPIQATADGVVVRARRSGGYGNLVMLRHDLGYATLYGHASRLLVKEGDQVKRGQVIATMGSTGRSTGSHVHYEVWFNGRTVNPARFLKGQD